MICKSDRYGGLEELEERSYLFKMSAVGLSYESTGITVISIRFQTSVSPKICWVNIFKTVWKFKTDYRQAVLHEVISKSVDISQDI